MFGQIFLWQQVKRSMPVSNKHDIYKLPHEFPNNLRLMILENYEISRKPKNFIEL